MDIIPFFPNPFSYSDYEKILTDENRDLNPVELGFDPKYQFINSGSEGITLLLKSFHLPINSRVGMPPLLCNSVKRAVIKADLQPFYFDISSEFQLQFTESVFKNSEIKVLILPHYYGAIYPYTEQVIKWCKENSVYLISDAAQSFGLEYKGKPVIEMGDGGIYSFGPGKASTCAGSAIVYGLNKIDYNENNLLNNILLKKSLKLLKERTAEFNIPFKNDISKKLDYLLYNIISNWAYQINFLQYNSIKHYLKIREDICLKRKRNWQIFNNELDPDIFRIPRYYKDTFKYKYVFNLNLPDGAVKKFIDSLKLLGININTSAKTNISLQYKKILPNYFRLRNKLCEVSTEASIPEENILNAAHLMNDYFCREL
jgi:dTDP-4-amino-4,6-dideoxygalactose transaminase